MIFLLNDLTVRGPLRKRVAESAAEEIAKQENVVAKDFSVYDGHKHEAPSIVLTEKELDRFEKKKQELEKNYKDKKIKKSAFRSQYNELIIAFAKEYTHIFNTYIVRE